ncbi:MAG: hypothetical protein Q9195_001278 [Heterodermia aff. obscurata]
MASKPKISFSLASPYAEEAWPTASPQDQATILEKLTDVLRPVGQYRSQHVTVSRGKRAKRRSKRARKKANLEGGNQLLSHSDKKAPEVLEHVTVGFNSTTRFLECLAQRSSSMGFEDGADNPRNKPRTSESMQGNQLTAMSLQAEPLAAVFISHSNQASKLYAHLPVLIRAGNEGTPEALTTRVVMLPEAAEAKLSTALKIPRVGIIGLMSAPLALELIDLVRAKVPPLKLPQLEQVAAGIFLPVNIVQTVGLGPK